MLDKDEIKEFQEGLKKRLKEEQNKTRAVLTSITDGLIVFDKNKRITLVNPDAENKLKIKEKDVLNKKIEEILDFPAVSELYKAIDRKIKWTGRKYELILEKPIRRFFDVFITPIASGKEVVGMIIIIHDVTRDKEISRMKTEFVSIAAHQLRTPLSAIKWSLHMVLDGDVGKISLEQVEFLQRAYKSNERMILLINDLLNVSRIEEGRFIYNQEACSLEEIIKNTINLLDRLSKERKVKLIFKKSKK
ncbi:MAG: PAS domain-containing protein, partial [Pelagibacterales bacterium]|nr:PAS domain-containing protein [Pelagibacterales bacterium]